MLHRKLYQLYTDGQEVWIYLRDQQRLIDRARIVDIEGNVVTIRYETDEEDEVCAWEEIVNIESIGSISRRLAAVPRGYAELAVSEECPEAEQLPRQSSETEHER
ncbi:hypothetical protein RYO59_002507 [Thermosynechococcaceae cyanobacterium Okahandja]